jgi:hypothetical protein
MNPLPFIAMAANCTLGSFYGQITRDWYLIVANGVGVFLSECAAGCAGAGASGSGVGLREDERATERCLRGGRRRVCGQELACRCQHPQS